MVTFKLTGSQAKWIKDNLPGFIETFEDKASDISCILVSGNISVYRHSFQLIFMSDKTATSTICCVNDYGVEWRNLEAFQFIGIYQGIMQNNPKIAKETDSEYVVLKKTIIKHM